MIMIPPIGFGKIRRGIEWKLDSSEHGTSKTLCSHRIVLLKNIAGLEGLIVLLARSEKRN